MDTLVLLVAIVAGGGGYLLGRAHEREAQVAARRWLFRELEKATGVKGGHGPA